MPADAAPAPGGEPPAGVENEARAPQLARLQANCRRQGLLIDRLCETISVLRSGAGALKAENAALRSETARLRGASAGAGETEDPDPLVQACLRMDVHAPAAARAVVADCLRVHVGPRRLQMAQLIVSELVTECLLDGLQNGDHSMLLRVRLEGGRCRLEVDAPPRSSRAPVYERRAPDLLPGLCDAWGSEHAADGGTRSWADLARAPLGPGQPSHRSRLRLVGG
jgi:hypothetical protein